MGQLAALLEGEAAEVKVLFAGKRESERVVGDHGVNRGTIASGWGRPPCNE